MSTDKKEEQVQATQSSPAANTVSGDGNAALSEATRQELIAALQQNWQREIEGVRTYRDLAQRERDRTRRAILEKLADAEQRHAQKWENKLAELGAEPPREQRTLSMRFQGWLRRQLGTEAALRQLEGEEDK